MTLACRPSGKIVQFDSIGRFKLEELGHYRSPVELDVMRSVNRALDPQSLIKPGKVRRPTIALAQGRGRKVDTRRGGNRHSMA